MELAKARFAIDHVGEAQSIADQTVGLLPASHLAQAIICRLRGEIAKKMSGCVAAIHWLSKAADWYMSLGEFGAWQQTMSEIAKTYSEEKEFDRAYFILDETRRKMHQALLARGIVL